MCAQGRCATRLRYAPTLRDSESISWLFRTIPERTESASAYPDCQFKNPSALNRTIVATFISERRYLQNVSPKTLEWYTCSFKAFEPFIATACDQTELPVAIKES